VASRKSIRARLRETATDELLVLVRRLGLILYVVIVSVTFRLIGDSLPGQHGNLLPFLIYGGAVIHSVPRSLSRSRSGVLQMLARSIEKQ